MPAAAAATSAPPAKKARHPDVDQECRIVKDNNVLIVLSGAGDEAVQELARDFCGAVVTDLSRLPSFPGKTVYLCGDTDIAGGLGLDAAERVFIIRELHTPATEGRATAAWPMMGVGRVPILVHDVGVYYRNFFSEVGTVEELADGVAGDSGEPRDYFSRIHAEHAFQTLTESTKPGTAHRTGIYLTSVESVGEEVHFRLLRCSSNFSGPTVNFGPSDRHIVEELNREAAGIFENRAPLNHVLAQVYHNTHAEQGQKQTKAKIKAHSDKTKDMPGNGLMAFCTFYDVDGLGRLEASDTDAFDFCHKGISGLTKLHFRLKDCVAERPGCSLTPRFSVTLYPDSAFFMPLSTNRLYTHEIRPAALDARLLPTRMGYVVRCSSTEAVHKGGATFLKMRGDGAAAPAAPPQPRSGGAAAPPAGCPAHGAGCAEWRRLRRRSDPGGALAAHLGAAAGGALARLEPPTAEGMRKLRALYAEENLTDTMVDYESNGPVLFSMNQGDYSRPSVHSTADEFRSLAVPTDAGIFEELLGSVAWEDVGKGRQGAVLVRPHGERGVPVLRTTTKYAGPARCFRPVHEALAQRIRERAALPFEFNNALIENYTNAYAKMGFHSDQDLDMEDGTHIAVFSCYRHPELARPPRKLVVESKEPGGGTFEIPMPHNSVVTWSFDTNRRFRHKIVLDTAAHPPENQWLGVTFRTSKTFVQFRDGQACFEDGTPLTLADDGQRGEFIRLRGNENKGTDFVYPRLTYTISESDMMPPEPAEAALRTEAPHPLPPASPALGRDPTAADAGAAAPPTCCEPPPTDHPRGLDGLLREGAVTTAEWAAMRARLR